MAEVSPTKPSIALIGVKAPREVDEGSFVEPGAFWRGEIVAKDPVL